MIIKCETCDKKYYNVSVFPIHCSCGCLIYEDRIEERVNNFPPVVQQLKNLVSSTVEHISTGMKTVPDEVKQNRLAICNSCPHYKDSRCTKCGCFMSVKADWAEQACPIGKWTKHEEGNNNN